MLQAPFKKYTRGGRVQAIEELFDKGMAYTEAPITEGFARRIVNYDIKDSGQILSCRPALVTDEEKSTVIGTPYVAGTNFAGVSYNNGTDTDLYVLNKVSDTKLEGTKLHNSTTTFFNIADGASPIITDTLSLVPTKASIHTIPVEDTTTASRLVGTFAFNNDYYFPNGTVLNRTTYDTEESKYVVKPVELYKLSAKEAVLWGYNMLAPDPYSFENQHIGGTIQLEGMLPYKVAEDGTKTLLLSPQLNQDITFYCAYRAPTDKEYTIKWEWREVTASAWNTLSEKKITFTDLPDLKVNFSPPSEKIMIKLTATTKTDGIDVIEQTLAVGFNFTKQDYGSATVIETKNYDLNKASGWTYWKNRLVCYGAQEDSTVLFLGDVNNPGYFPYPNNIHTFAEPIIYATPFLDNLLVFTSTTLHMLTLAPDGLTINTKKVQGNLYISEWDTHLIQVVKNMVFFKSGNYYYMIVPRVQSLTGELTIAPVSKPITDFLNNFQKELLDITNLLYNNSSKLTLQHYYNYLDYEDVHNVYVFQAESAPVGSFVNVDLLYNTMSRTWRIYIYESTGIMQPYLQDSTQSGVLVSIYDKDGNTGVQFRKYDTEHSVDSNLTHALDYTQKFVNYQLLDTGYREHGSDFKRRYRRLADEDNKQLTT